MVLVTQVIVKLFAQAGAGETDSGDLRSHRRCGETVEKITAHAITPAAIEMMDGVSSA